jgi:flagellar basal-body rod protein FlgG
MIRSLFIASSGMKAQQLHLDVIANNLANVNTTGFKKSRVDFQSLFYESLQRPAAFTEGGFNRFAVQVGTGVRVAATPTEFNSGIIEQTGNDLDLAIEGRGFFMVELPSGEVGFTRNGSFRLDGEGCIVNGDGHRLLSTKGNVSPENSLSVAGEELSYIKPDTDALTVSIGTDGTILTEKDISDPPVLTLAWFTNPGGLQAVGSTTYTATVACGESKVAQAGTESLGLIRAGFLEESNVQIVDEMVRMIIAQRAYEISSKSIQTSDDMMGITNNLKR